MSDESRYGTARPLFRILNDRYVLNDGCMVKCRFPKVPIVNRGVTGNEFEHIKGYRGFFELTFYKIDKPSQNLLETIIDVDADSANPLYMRPHFNWHKELNVRCLNGLEFDELLERIDAGYKAVLQFTSIPLETSSNIRSYGSFYLGDQDYWTTGALTDNLTGDVSIEFWVRWQDPLGTKAILYLTDVDPPNGVNWQIDTEGSGTLSFITGPTGAGSHLVTDAGTFEVNKWYHIVCKRINTDDKYIYVNGVEVATASDLLGANNLNSLKIGHTTAAFDGHIQILRAYDSDIDVVTYGQNLMIEAIPSAYITALKIWFDFSKGDATDLSGNSNDGTLTGAENYYSESFPDSLYEML